MRQGAVALNALQWVRAQKYSRRSMDLPLPPHLSCQPRPLGLSNRCNIPWPAEGGPQLGGVRCSPGLGVNYWICLSVRTFLEPVHPSVPPSHRIHQEWRLDYPCFFFSFPSSLVSFIFSSLLFPLDGSMAICMQGWPDGWMIEWEW